MMVFSSRKSSPGVWYRVVVVRTDVSEEIIVSIFRAGELRRESYIVFLFGAVILIVFSS
jgi:hypothetical protein